MLEITNLISFDLLIKNESTQRILELMQIMNNELIKRERKKLELDNLYTQYKKEKL